eukprot:509553-Rhodomonas_salina.1
MRKGAWIPYRRGPPASMTPTNGTQRLTSFAFLKGSGRQPWFQSRGRQVCQTDWRGWCRAATGCSSTSGRRAGSAAWRSEAGPSTLSTWKHSWWRSAWMARRGWKWTAALPSEAPLR